MKRRSFLTRLVSAIAVPLFIPDTAIRSILDKRIVLPKPWDKITDPILVPLVATVGPENCDFSSFAAWQEALNEQCPNGLDNHYTAECAAGVDTSLSTFEFPNTTSRHYITIRGGDMPAWLGVEIVPNDKYRIES